MKATLIGILVATFGVLVGGITHAVSPVYLLSNAPALLVVIVGIYLWSTYNGLVRLNVRVDEAWSDITVQLKRRADLIPNLIEAVKGYAAHEKQVFENVTKARSETVNASTPAEAGAARPMAIRLAPMQSFNFESIVIC